MTLSFKRPDHHFWANATSDELYSLDLQELFAHLFCANQRTTEAFLVNTQLTDKDRCILLSALKRFPWHLDALSTTAWTELHHGAPWAPYGTLEAWQRDHDLGD